MESYVWTPSMNGFFKADANMIGRELESLEEITPENVLEYAKDPDSELHKCFDWDDTSAANKYRLTQARQVIRFIMIAPKKKEEVPVRKFEISSERNVYKSRQFFQQNKDEYAKLLERAKNAYLDLENRYRTLAELEPIRNAVHEVFN